MKDETIVKLEEVSNTFRITKSGVIELALKIISETSNLIMKARQFFIADKSSNAERDPRRPTKP